MYFKKQKFFFFDWKKWWLDFYENLEYRLFCVCVCVWWIFLSIIYHISVSFMIKDTIFHLSSFHQTFFERFVISERGHHYLEVGAPVLYWIRKKHYPFKNEEKLWIDDEVNLLFASHSDTNFYFRFCIFPFLIAWRKVGFLHYRQKWHFGF